MTIEGRIIPETDDMRDEDDEWYEHKFNTITDSAYKSPDMAIPVSIHQAMFLTYFEGKSIAAGRLPKGYMYFHDTEEFSSALAAESARRERDGESTENSLLHIMDLLHKEGLRPSQAGLSEEEMEKSADFKKGGYFDATMVVKTPANLGLVYNEEFYENYYVSEEERENMVNKEARVVESLVFAEGANTGEDGTQSIGNTDKLKFYDKSYARGRPVNKHAAYFRQPFGLKNTEADVDRFIFFHKQFLENQVNNPGVFAKFFEFFGYGHEWRVKRLETFKRNAERR